MSLLVARRAEDRRFAVVYHVYLSVCNTYVHVCVCVYICIIIYTYTDYAVWSDAEDTADAAQVSWKLVHG